MLNAKIIRHQKNWLSLRHACLQSAPAAERFCDKWCTSRLQDFKATSLPAPNWPRLLSLAPSRSFASWQRQSWELASLIKKGRLVKSHLHQQPRHLQLTVLCSTVERSATSAKGGLPSSLLMPTPEVRRSVATGRGLCDNYAKRKDNETSKELAVPAPCLSSICTSRRTLL